MNIMETILGKIFHPHDSVSAPQASSSPAATHAEASAKVDVNEILNNLAAKKAEKLNWRTSVVDLMKLLDLDSSFAARKQLAEELNFTGDMANSAEMNLWLQKKVMQKLAENGGNVPQDLKH